MRTFARQQSYIFGSRSPSFLSKNIFLQISVTFSRSAIFHNPTLFKPHYLLAGRNQHPAMSPHISNLPLWPTSSIPIEDQHHLSGELTGFSENPPRADQTREQTVLETEDENPDSMDVQEGEPGEHDLDLDLDLDLISENLPVPQQLQVQVQVPTKPFGDHLTWEDALFNSQTTARLLPHLPPYEHSFWTDSVLCGPRPSGIKGCGLSVVHRRLYKSSPETRDFAILWEQELFVARNIHDKGHGQMLAVLQALTMAVDQCERISGIPVTKARIKQPGAAAQLKRCAVRAPGVSGPCPRSSICSRVASRCWSLSLPVGV
jgi:hypothetical protein